MTKNPDLREFLETPVEEKALPPKNGAIVKIRRDLVQSRAWFSVYFIFLTLLGYFVSLSICEQHNLGFFVLSQAIAEEIAKLPSLVCAAVCGILFTGIPFAVSRMFLNRFHQRYLLTRLWWLTFLLPAIAVAILLTMPHLMGMENTLHQHASENQPFRNNTWMLVWALSALATPYLLEGTMFISFLRKRKE
jgi:hypothetical protein